MELVTQTVSPPERKVRWESSPKAFRKQVLGLLTEEDKRYVIQLGLKRAKDYAADEFNYGRNARNQVVFLDPEEMLADIADEIGQTIFDRLLFSGCITEADYDDAMYFHEAVLDGSAAFLDLAGTKLQLWHNEDAARRFVENDVEHDPAYYGLDDDAELNIDDIEPEEDFGKIMVSGEDVMELLGWKKKDEPRVEQAVLLAERSLDAKSRAAFVAFCESEGRNVKADNVFFFSSESFCQFITHESVRIEKRARAELFRLLDEQYGLAKSAALKMKLKDVFALALFFRLTGHSMSMGADRIGNFRLKRRAGKENDGK